jgi:hypothetical protein
MGFNVQFVDVELLILAYTIKHLINYASTYLNVVGVVLVKEENGA